MASLTRRPTRISAETMLRIYGMIFRRQRRDWLAAFGTITDLGRDWTMPPLIDVQKKYCLTSLREIVSVVNAARRVSVTLAEQAGSLLAAFDNPEDFLHSAQLTPLRQAKATIQASRCGSRPGSVVLSLP